MCFLKAAFFLIVLLQAATDVAPPKIDRLDIKASFIVCMIEDGNGGTFVGTEDHGVYHYDRFGDVIP